MSKHTSTVILPSYESHGPWGDTGWRCAGSIQYVVDGPDFLLAHSPTPQAGPEPRGHLVLRTNPTHVAQDIAAMVFAVVGLPECEPMLEQWFDSESAREDIYAEHRDLFAQLAAPLKIGLVETTEDGLGQPVRDALTSLGFTVVRFTEGT